MEQFIFRTLDVSETEPAAWAEGYSLALNAFIDVLEPKFREFAAGTEGITTHKIAELLKTIQTELSVTGLRAVADGAGNGT